MAKGKKEEKEICPKCKSEIAVIIEGPFGDRKEVKKCSCPNPSKKRGAWGN